VQPCPSQSLPACPVRGVHANAPQDAAQGTYARGGQADCVGGGVRPGRARGRRGPSDESDSEDSTLVTSDEGEGEEPGKSRLCMQMVLVEANGVMHGLHTLYDWGSTVTLVRRESMRRMGFWPAQVAQRLVSGFGGLPLLTVSGCAREASGDLCL
jgi:hypothetical protein